MYRLWEAYWDGGSVDVQLLADAEAALSEFVKAMEAHVRQAAKQGFRRKPTGEELTLLQVRATQRCADALEGILDVMRAKVSFILPTQRFDVVLTANSMVTLRWAMPTRQLTPRTRRWRMRRRGLARG